MSEKVAHNEHKTVDAQHASPVTGPDQKPAGKEIIVQPSLYVSAADDPMEKEAEQTAERVMRMPSPGASPPPPGDNQHFIWRQATPATNGNGIAVNNAISSEIRQQQGSGAKMDTGTKSFMEARFGANFSQVKVHNDSQAAHLSHRLQANAFTTGNDIFFNQNQYNPASSEGKQLLAHELTHVLQQGQGLQRQYIYRQALPTDLSGYPAAERSAIQISWVALPSGSLPALNDLFGTTPATAGGTAVSRNRPAGTLVFNGNVPASPSTSTGYDVRHGLSNLAHYFQQTTNHLPLNSTITFTLDLTPYGGANTNYRFSFFTHTIGSGASATQTQVFLIEQLAASVAIPTVADPANAAATGSFTAGGQTFTLGSGWNLQQKAILDQALALVPANGLTQLAGVTFDIGGSVSSEEGHYDESTHTITIRSSAFANRLNAYEGGSDAVRIILHEIAHAIDRRAVRLAWNTYSAGNNTAGTRRTLESARSLSGSSYVYDASTSTHNLEEGATNTAFRTAVIQDRTAAGASPPGGISSYSTTNWEENFAEAMSFYMVDRQLFQQLRPNTYAYFLTRYPGPVAPANPAPAGANAPAPAVVNPPAPGETISRQVIQRDDAVSTARYLSYAQVQAKTVTQFITYIHTQTDWFSAPSLSQDQRQEIELLIFFLTDEVQAVFPSKTISQFHTLFDVTGELADERQDRLKAYAAAVSARKHPFEISNFATTLTQAVNVGRDILLLQSAFPDYVLHTAMKEEPFKLLRNAGFLNDLIAYYTTAVQRPIFQANNGGDFNSFFLFRQSGTSPLHYDSTNLLNRIRNYHRFEKTALDRLIINYNTTTRAKPLTLILHTALDHNAAFHRDPFLTAVITNNAMLTLMIEGFATLSEVQAQIEPIANTYGINNRINQLMFAGHGSERGIELAGSISEEVTARGEHRIHEDDQGLNLDTNREATEHLIDEVLRFMDNDTTLPADRQRNSRVVFNACLTGSNAVSEAITEGDMAGAQTHVTNYISTHASLATFLDQYASSNNADLLTSIGSNASFGQVSLLGSGNTLDIISAGDPAITSTKIDYVERGTEPEGALRAVLETWAANQPNTIAAMNRRMARTESNEWDIRLIRGAYAKIISTFSTDAEKIRRIGAVIGSLSELKSEENCLKTVGWRIGAGRVAAHVITDDFYADLLRSVAPATEFTSNKRIKASILHLWCMKEAAKDADLMAVVGSNTVNFLIQFVDITYLEDNRGVLTRLFGIGSDGAKLRLALHGMLADPINATSRAHLMTVLAGASTFPAGLGVTAALGGATTQSNILELLGVNAAAPAPAVGGGAPVAPAHTSNIRLHGQTDNTVYINPIQQFMGFMGYLVKILRERPDSSSRFVADVSDENQFYVLGDTADYYAIQYTYEGETIPSVAFLRKQIGLHRSVTNLNP